MRHLIRALRAALLFILALALLFEEWGWVPLAAFFARLARWPVWGAVERLIAALPPALALLAFFLPALLLLPVKLLAILLFSRGHYGSGLLLLVSAKIAGTALLARMFYLTQPALMRIPLFARWYPRWKHWKDRLLVWVRASAAWAAVSQLRERLKAWWAALRTPPAP